MIGHPDRFLFNAHNVGQYDGICQKTYRLGNHARTTRTQIAIQTLCEKGACDCMVHPCVGCPDLLPDGSCCSHHVAIEVGPGEWECIPENFRDLL
jgi:hypothetical protein